jgi:hypothetical protein
MSQSLVDKLETRDKEVLRTLARLRYLRTAQLVGTLFSCDEVARRRMRHLAGLNLVRTHTRGLPPGCGYHAWRLSGEGVVAVQRSFPEETVPDGLSERLGGGSLANPHHREALIRIYLALIAGERPAVAPGDNESARALARAFRARANAFSWAADGDVTLRYVTTKKNAAGEARAEEWVIPDATVLPAERQVRLFVELDRSTHKRAQVRDSLRRYRRYFKEAYAGTFPDGRTPYVLLIAPSAARQRSLAAIGLEVFGSHDQCGAVVETEAVARLADLIGLPALVAPEPAVAVVADAPPAAAPPELAAFRETADVTYRALKDYRRHLKEYMQLIDPDFDFPPPVMDALRRLYTAAYGEVSP